MPALICNLAAVTVAGLFYAWRAHRETIANHRRMLCQRVAYMLWVAAQKAA